MTKAFQSTSVGIKNVQFGSNVTVIEPSNLYGCNIGNEVFIGPFVEIQVGVKIDAGTRIQSHTFICEGVSIGRDCFIGHGVMFVNDLLRNGPARGDKSKWEKTKIGNDVSIGSNATVLPVNICDGVIIGAGSVVTRDITEPGIYLGNPARRVKQ